MNCSHERHFHELQTIIVVICILWWQSVWTFSVRTQYQHEYLGTVLFKLYDEVVPVTAHNFQELATWQQGYGYEGSAQSCYTTIHYSSQRLWYWRGNCDYYKRIGLSWVTNSHATISQCHIHGEKVGSFPPCSGLGKHLTWLDYHPEQAGLSCRGFGGPEFSSAIMNL